MAQFGRALRSGRRGRRFESCHLDQKSVDFVGGFFIQADRLGISSRFSVYIIAAFMRRISSHHRCAYLYRLDEIQWLCHWWYAKLTFWWYTRLRLDFKTRYLYVFSHSPVDFYWFKILNKQITSLLLICFNHKIVRVYAKKYCSIFIVMI